MMMHGVTHLGHVLQNQLGLHGPHFDAYGAQCHEEIETRQQPTAALNAVVYVYDGPTVALRRSFDQIRLEQAQVQGTARV